jgi:putative membrane protein
MMGYLFNGMAWWMVFGVLFWGGIIWLIVWAVKKATEHKSSDTMNQNAIDIAKTRYARGEITKDQFEQIKKELS